MKPKFEWKHRTKFPIQDRMVDVIQKTLKVSQDQREVLLRKLRKMQLGS